MFYSSFYVVNCTLCILCVSYCIIYPYCSFSNYRSAVFYQSSVLAATIIINVYLMSLVSWKGRGLVAVCRCSEGSSLHLPHIGQRPAELSLVVQAVPYIVARPVPTRRLQLRNQVGDTVRIRTALCMFRPPLLVLLVVGVASLLLHRRTLYSLMYDCRCMMIRARR